MMIAGVTRSGRLTPAFRTLGSSNLQLLLTRFRTKRPWPVKIPALGVISPGGNLYISASIIASARPVGGRTARKSQQDDGGDY